MAGATLVEKIIARASGRSSVAPGEVVTAKVDLAFAHDSSGPRRWKPMLDELGVGLWDASKIAIVTDHYTPAADVDSAAILKLTREFARDHGVANFFDMVGICHLVLPQHGLIRPGAFIAGGDSHTPMAGAFGAYAAGYGATDMVGIVATGETWLMVPETLRIDWDGAFARGVTAKDVMLRLCRELGLDNAFRAIEFGGEAVDAMPMAERMVLCNMAAELGAETGVVAPDDTTFEYLRAAQRPVTDEAAARALRSDPDARYAASHRFDASRLTPQIAAPHSPDNTRDAGELEDVKIDQAYIGACVGAKLEDLHMAAQILRGRRVASGVRLLVAPASAATTEAAARDGTLATLAGAGAILLSSGCGACAGYGGGVLSAGEVCISSTNRNFKGRMGDGEAQVYLGSPYSVAAAAVAGHITDPRPMLQSDNR
jgi:3-isopropylmalate/(R)-2-methylmalate dehydratase large subunit